MKKFLFGTLSILAITMAAQRPLLAQDGPEKYGWSFRNFPTATFYWDIYRNSMFGIPQDSSGLTAPFDLLFYSDCFKDKLAGGSGGGNCFGLSLMSLIMNKDGGQLGYCCPTNFYGGTSGVGPSDPKLTRAINIMHGHQVTLACIQTFFDQFLNGHSQDATYVTPLAQQALDKEGFFVVSVTKSLLPGDGGHSLVAYKMTNLGGSHYKIWVVDPNRIWADSTTPDNRDFYVSNKNFIDCNGSSWKYDMGGSLGIWPTGSGNLTVLPVSIAAPTGRVPSSLGLAVGELLNKIFIVHNGEDAEITQITSGGKRLFIPGTKQVDWNVQTGMRNISPFYPSDMPKDGHKFQFELYYHFGAMANANIDFYSGTKGAEVVMGDNTGYLRVKCNDAGAHATISATGIGTASPTIQIKNVSKPITCDIDLLIPTKPGEINRTFSIHNVTVSPAEHSFVECDISNARDITVKGNSENAASFSVSQQAAEHTKNFSTQEIVITPSHKQTWQEADWMRLVPIDHAPLTGK
ncbi:MAG TPA: hypothetical protein VEW28_05725 [Candidatus Kapabacteria bacterium]|nr:hypothetical protein [Candidatus Kapabacteria bacterium]